MAKKITVASYEGNVKLDYSSRIIYFGTHDGLRLTQIQVEFFKALIEGSTLKKEIVQKLWGNCDSKNADNNYHQLICQIRKLLKSNCLPTDILMTIHKHGIKFNPCIVSPSDKKPALKLLRMLKAFLH